MRLRHWPLFLLLAASCTDDVDFTPVKIATLEILSGDEQQGAMADFVQQPLRMVVKPAFTEILPERFYLVAEMVEGNGTITSVSRVPSGDRVEMFQPIQGSPSQRGQFEVYWSLGCNQVNQKVNFHLYSSDSCSYDQMQMGFCRKPIASVTFSATASTRPPGWTKSCGISTGFKTTTKFKKYDNTNYVLSNGSIYKAVKSSALSWEKIPAPSTMIIDFGYTGGNWLYILTSDQGILRSQDMINWAHFGTGISDQSNPLGLYADDKAVYVSFYYGNIYRIRPGEENWTWIYINGSYWGQWHFARHPNGKLYSTSSSYNDIYVSENDGDTWTWLPLEYWTYVNSTASDLAIDDNGLFYIGSSDAWLATLSTENYQGEVRKYASWNGYSQYVDNIQFYNGHVYFLINLGLEAGIYSSENNWMEHNLGFTKPIHHFTMDNSGDFFIASDDGIYYLQK